jgi:hypothetical protein
VILVHFQALETVYSRLSRPPSAHTFATETFETLIPLLKGADNQGTTFRKAGEGIMFIGGKWGSPFLGIRAPDEGLRCKTSRIS